MVIPADWKEVRLGDHASMRSGGTPLTSVASFYGGTIPWASISDMSASGKYLSVTDRSITEAGLASSPAVVFPERVLLYAMYASIGECCISLSPMATSQAILGIKCASSLDLEFLYYIMQSKRAEIALSGQQGTQSNLNAQMVRETLFTMPPLKEQEAIAEALSDADAAIESLDALIAKKRDVKQATMQQLLTGRTRLPGFTADWKEVRLGDLGPLSKGVGIRKNEVTPYGVPCVRYGQIYTEYNFVIGEIQTFVSPQVASNSRPLRKGEILFAGSGETKEDIGKCIAYVADVGAVAGGDIVVLTPEGADSRFLGYLLNSPNVAQQKMSRAQGDAVVHISAVNLASISLKLPPLEEQEAIAEALSVMEDELKALTKQMTKLRMVKEGMMQDLLTGKVRLA